MSEIVISGKKYAIMPKKWKCLKNGGKQYLFDHGIFLSKKYLFKKSIIDSNLDFSLKELIPLLKNIKRNFGTFLISEEESYTYSIVDGKINIVRYPGRYGEQILKEAYSVVTYNLDTLKTATLFVHKHYQQDRDWETIE